MVPRSAVLRHRAKVQSDQLARARYERRHPNRNHHDKEAEALARDIAWSGKEFVMWDGEGPTDAGYALFGNSLGNEICHPFLGTVECLSLLLDSAAEKPDAIHIAFGFNYDVSNILRELPHRYLRMLATYTKTIWMGYKIEHVPHKWFAVSRGNTRIKIYDIRSFFGGNYQGALEDFRIGTDEERAAIAAGKGDRPYFKWAEIESIRNYYRLELKLGPVLMDKLRELFKLAGYVPRSWHGPGALARMALKRHKIYNAMKPSPPAIHLAALFAFAAGRFELFIAGHIRSTIYNGDIHSAYPYFATMLPNLAKGKWRTGRNYEPGKFALYHIRYRAKPDNRRPYPLFRRLDNGSIVWPNEVEGWYWSPEAELVAKDPDAEFLEAYIFDELDPSDRPFKFLAEMYDLRRKWKDDGNAAEYTLKLIINSVFGQLAQRAGWDRKTNSAPRSHQIEWAGFITSSCRAAVYTAARKCGEKLVSIDTDGIYSSAPIPDLDIGPNLGQWDTTEYTDGVFWQSGIYCLATGEGWKKAKNKSRGIRKGSYTVETLMEGLHRGGKCNNNDCDTEQEHIHLSRRLFITYGLADIHGWDKFNTWQDEPHVFLMGGGKRIHFPNACRFICDPPAHILGQWSATYGVTPETALWSKRHKLPWMETRGEPRRVLEAMQMFNVDDLDPEDEWVESYG